MSGDREEIEVRRCAEQLATRVNEKARSFAEARQVLEGEYTTLLHAVRASDERFAFDRDGRPGAVRAIREALPLMERDLFDAVLDDHACEIAAVEEALYQLALALARARR
jgi:hypothetical protein